MEEKRCWMARKGINLLLIIIGVLGFVFSSFFLIYYQVKGGFLLSVFFMILFLEAFILRVEMPVHHKERIVDVEPRRHMIPTPLSSGFMLTSIVGGIIALFVILPLSVTWGVTFTVVFVIMLISSIASMTMAPPPDEALQQLHMEELAVHNKLYRKKKAQ